MALARLRQSRFGLSTSVFTADPERFLDETYPALDMGEMMTKLVEQFST